MKLKISALCALGAVALALLAGCVTPISPAPRVAATGLTAEQAGRAERNLRLFDTVWSTVEQRYYEPKLHGVDWRAAAMTWICFLGIGTAWS